LGFKKLWVTRVIRFGKTWVANPSPIFGMDDARHFKFTADEPLVTKVSKLTNFSRSQPVTYTVKLAIHVSQKWCKIVT